MIGPRGLFDTRSSSTDPSVLGNDRLRGARIGAAMACQIAIVRARRPGARFITNLWQEGHGW